MQTGYVSIVDTWDWCGSLRINKTDCCSRKHAEEMGFEVTNGHPGSIASMTTWWNKLHFHLVFVANYFLHCFRYFIINDVLLWNDSCPFETYHSLSIRPGQLWILATS